MNVRAKNNQYRVLGSDCDSIQQDQSIIEKHSYRYSSLVARWITALVCETFCETSFSDEGRNDESGRETNLDKSRGGPGTFSALTHSTKTEPEHQETENESQETLSVGDRRDDEQFLRTGKDGSEDVSRRACRITCSQS